MKKIVPDSGDILQIPLIFNLGFSYAKYIDARKISNSHYPSMINVYKYWTKDRGFEFTKIAHNGYLFDPILIAGIKPTMKEKLWLKIGNIPPTTYDLLTPKFKTHEPIWDIEENAKKWFVVEGFDKSIRTEASFDQVRHLWSLSAFGTGNIEIMITMHILIMENIPITNYFDLSNETYKYQYKTIVERLRKNKPVS